LPAEITLTEETFGVIKKITWKWTAHTDGKVAITTPNAKTTKSYNGEIVRLVTIPDATTAPTAAYDVKIYDDDSVDALVGAGADRSATATEQVLASNLGVIANDHLALYVENAGAGKGTVILYVR
jgi:phage tail protein X